MNTPTPYNHEDFTRNPGKYQLFRTAVIAEPITSLPEIAVGQVVKIQYVATQINAGRDNIAMPVYQVWPDSDPKTSSVMLYACAMGNFVL